MHQEYIFRSTCTLRQRNRDKPRPPTFGSRQTAERQSVRFLDQVLGEPLIALMVVAVAVVVNVVRRSELLSIC